MTTTRRAMIATTDGCSFDSVTGLWSEDPVITSFQSFVAEAATATTPSASSSTPTVVGRAPRQFPRSIVPTRHSALYAATLAYASCTESGIKRDLARVRLARELNRARAAASGTPVEGDYSVATCDFSGIIPEGEF